MVMLPTVTVEFFSYSTMVAVRVFRGVQASLLTVDSLDTVEIAHQIIVQADVQSALGNAEWTSWGQCSLPDRPHSPERPAASS